ncbi:MAG: hypothetical protein AAF514_22625, partial [Verrucomicrobiota bacterium]
MENLFSSSLMIPGLLAIPLAVVVWRGIRTIKQRWEVGALRRRIGGKFRFKIQFKAPGQEGPVLTLDQEALADPDFLVTHNSEKCVVSFPYNLQTTAALAA